MAEQAIVDDDGAVFMDAGGKAFVTVSDGECPDIPNCCRLCFEVWFSEWVCGSGWTDVDLLGTFCLPDDTPTGAWISKQPWEGGLRDSGPCVQYFYRACADPTTCTLADPEPYPCAPCDGTTDAPAAAPTEDVSAVCCDDCPCPSEPGGTRSGSPTSYTLSFENIQSSPKCSRVLDSPFENWRMDFSGLNGQSYTFGGGCPSSYDVDVKVRECHGTGVGDPDANGCDCGPTDDVTVSAVLTPGQISVVWSYRGGTTGPAIITFPYSYDCHEEVFHLPEATGGENWYDMLHGLIIKTVCGGC